MKPPAKAHGGARPGSGRKPGTANRRTREIADKAIKGGLTPLEYMLQVVRDEKEDRSVRLDAAKGAAPYIHPKLCNVEANVKGDVGLTVQIVRFDDNPAT